MATAQSDAITNMGESYDENCRAQLSTIDLSVPFVRKAIDALDVDFSSSIPLVIADFGCAQGLNSFHIMKTIIKHLQQTNKKPGDLLVVHNDLPTNNWESLLQLLAEDKSYKSLVSGRSFYEQCLPDSFLSIGYTSTAIHWLSKKPCNISNHCLCYFAVGAELSAFQHQARLDYSQFLEHRSRELRPGGVLILANPCLDDQRKVGLENVVDLLYTCGHHASFTAAELLDFTMPCYVRSYKEFCDEELFTRYHFEVLQAKILSNNWFTQLQEGQMSLDEFAHSVSSNFRSWTEQILQHILRKNNRAEEEISEVCDRFWKFHEQEVKQRAHYFPCSVNHAFLVLKKKSVLMQG